MVQMGVGILNIVNKFSWKIEVLIVLQSNSWKITIKQERHEKFVHSFKQII